MAELELFYPVGNSIRHGIGDVTSAKAPLYQWRQVGNVPPEFLQLLGRRSLSEVRRGDAVERDLVVMFSDIRSFTEISEQLTAMELFRYVNDYLERAGTIVRYHGGFIC